MRPRVVIVALVVLALAAVATAAEVLIEDWKSYPVGTTGLPGQWTAQSWGTPSYQNVTIADDGGRRALHIKSVNDSMTLSRDIRGKVNLGVTPILEWEWKAIVLPKGANACKKSTDDEAAQIYVVWPRFPEQVRSRIIGYVWDTTQPVGTVCRSEKTRMVTYVVVRSGPAELNTWLTERRDVVEDFRKIYGNAPDDPAALSLSIDSDDTKSTAESMMGAIRFKSR